MSFLSISAEMLESVLRPMWNPAYARGHLGLGPGVHADLGPSLCLFPSPLAAWPANPSHFSGAKLWSLPPQVSEAVLLF